MATFQFRYHTLLHHRRHVEQERQRELAKCLKTQMILGHQLREAEARQASGRRELAEALVGRVEVSRLGSAARFTRAASAAGREVMDRIEQARANAERARADLNIAVQDCKALELLHDQERDRWRREQERREAAILDEAGSLGYVRRGMGGVMGGGMGGGGGAA